MENGGNILDKGTIYCYNTLENKVEPAVLTFRLLAKRFKGIVRVNAGCLLRTVDAVLFFILIWRCFRISSLEHQINEEITDKEVRLIDDGGEQLGIVPIQEALEAAVKKGYDLVKIAPKAVPPVCRIMDYGKFRFEQTKREKEAKKNQKIVDIKEIRLTPNIDVNDFNVKLNHAIRFLKGGDKVKVSVRFRGREVTHASLGHNLLARFAEQCTEYGTVEKAAKLEGRQMMMFIAPKKG